MKIIEIRATRGPNFWSIWRHKLIVMTIDLEELEQKPTDKIKNFLPRLKKLLPGLYEHQCSEGEAGGFFKRVEEGTWMGHVIEHIALELQTMAGLHTGFGQTRSTGKTGEYHVVFSYVTESAGKYTAKAAVQVAQALVDGKKIDINPIIERIKKYYYDEHPGPSTQGIIDEAEKRGIPYFCLNGGAMIQFGYGARQKRIRATITSNTSSISVDIAGNKEETKELLEQFNIPVPKGTIIYNRHDLKEAIEKLGYPLVIKPLDGNQGKGATINVNDWRCALGGLLTARKYSKGIIVERFITGSDYRLLVINKKFVAASLRTPAMVRGDGVSTIKQLVDEVNKDPRRGHGHSNVLTRIKIDEMSKRILEDRGLTLKSVLPEGEVLFLKDTANLSTGGTSTDVTDLVHPHNVFLAEQIAQIVGLDICGIDVMTTDISHPLEETGGAVLEVNAAPGFRMHTHPTVGKPRNVSKPVIDMLFPNDEDASIPIVGVTGTNGKTTTIRLIAHMAKTAGHNVGYTNTDGIYLNNRVVERGDCSGPGSAHFILKNPWVDYAVLECARGGMLRSGLGFQYCHVAVVTNVAADHLGIGGINTLRDLAHVKSILPETVLPSGYAVLNAADDLVYKMRERTEGKIALFALDEKNKKLTEHIEKGGLAATVNEGFVTIYDGLKKIRIQEADHIPITFGGRATFMTENVLAGVLAGYSSGIPLDDIRKAVMTFVPSPEHTPGRLNLFKVAGKEVMIDYAHNPAGLAAVGSFVKNVESPMKIGIITGVGDRRDDDIVEMGEMSAKLFDKIIIRHDKDLRGRTKKEIENLLLKGINAVDPDTLMGIKSDEIEALSFALENAPDGSFILLTSEKPDKATEFLKSFDQTFATAVSLEGERKSPRKNPVEI